MAILDKNYRSVFWKKESIFESYLFVRVINELMNQGNKETVENVFYSSLRLLKLKKKIYNNYVLLFETIEVLRPFLEIVTRRLGHNFRDIPKLIKENLQYRKAIRWFIFSCKLSKFSSDIVEKLSYEFICVVIYSYSEAFIRTDVIYDSIVESKHNRFYSWRL